MTTCGYFWTMVIIVLCIIGVTVSAVVQDKRDRSGRPEQKTRDAGLGAQRVGVGPYRPNRGILTMPPNRGSSIEPGPRAFLRGGARYVTCSASTRLDDGYIVSMGGSRGDDPEKMLRYAKKELAAVLAEQALAAGGIEFTQAGGELRAVMRTVTGEIGTPLPGAEEGGTVSPQPRRWRDEAPKPGPGTANAARRGEEGDDTSSALRAPSPQGEGKRGGEEL